MINHWAWPNSGRVDGNSPESVPYHPTLQLSGHPDQGTPVFTPYGHPVAELPGSYQNHYYHHPTVVGGGWEEAGVVGFRPARIGLDLGGRTYFSAEDGTIAVVGGTPASVPRCQAEGCRADLRAAKHYHRRHKVCELHSKAATVVVAGGATQRFCQQCSRFHVLSEFDEGKRSCRKRLADHNRRRRKSQPASSSSQPDALSNNISTTSEAPVHTNMDAITQNAGKIMMGENAISWLRSTPSSSDFIMKRKLDEEDTMESGSNIEMLSCVQTFLPLQSALQWHHVSSANNMSEDDSP